MPESNPACLIHPGSNTPGTWNDRTDAEKIVDHDDCFYLEPSQAVSTEAQQSRLCSSPRSRRVEDRAMYRKGGYHPIEIDDVLNCRFQVLHKLGFGKSSTVWLCWDMLEEMLTMYIPSVQNISNQAIWWSRPIWNSLRGHFVQER